MLPVVPHICPTPGPLLDVLGLSLSFFLLLLWFCQSPLFIWGVIFCSKNCFFPCFAAVFLQFLCISQAEGSFDDGICSVLCPSHTSEQEHLTCSLNLPSRLPLHVLLFSCVLLLFTPCSFILDVVMLLHFQSPIQVLDESLPNVSVLLPCFLDNSVNGDLRNKLAPIAFYLGPFLDSMSVALD